jgi:cytochrome b6-f complex iron-sulfur subunit
LEQEPAEAVAGVPPVGARSGRRAFLRYLLGFSVFSTLAMVTTPVLGFLVPPKASSNQAGGRVLAGTPSDIPVGSGKVVAMGSTPVIVTNTAQGFHAFSAVCTHLGCIVAFDSTLGQIGCPCHGGVFNASTGAVVSGPPPAPLKPVTVVVEKDQLFLVNS